MMRLMALVFFLCGIATPAIPQAFFSATVFFSGSTWVAQNADGSIIVSSSDCIAVVNQAISAVYPQNRGNIGAYGAGQSQPCAGTNETLTVLAQRGNSFYGYAMVFSFNNGTQDGIHFDTQRDATWECTGCITSYSGNGVVVALQPTQGVGGVSCETVSKSSWALNATYDLGTLEATGGTPLALVYEDISQCAGSDFEFSTQFAANHIRFNGECRGHADYGIRIADPSNGFQAGGENWYQFGNIEECAVAGISIGNGTSLDKSIGTNHFEGNIAATSAKSYGIIEGACGDVFNLTSLENALAGKNGTAVYWQNNACHNTVNAQLLIGWANNQVGPTTGQNGNILNPQWSL